MVHPPLADALVVGEPAAELSSWLDAIAAWIDERLATGRPGVVTCSALKRTYRARLTHGRAGVRIVLLHGDPELLAARIQARADHFFDPTLLQSQLAANNIGPAQQKALVKSLMPMMKGPQRQRLQRILNMLGE